MTAPDPTRPARMTDLRRTTAFRLTAGMTVLFVAAILAILWLVYAQTAAELDQRTDLTISARAGILAAASPAQRMAMASAAIGDTTRRLEGIALFDRAHHRLIGDPGLDPPFPVGRVFDRQNGPRGVPVRALALKTADGQIVVVSRDNSPSLDLRARILAIMLIAGAGGIALTLGVGVALSIAPMRRIRRLEATAARIAAGELDLRIAISRRGDEFDMIAGIINTMVEDVARLLHQVKGSTDAIAHDLRTPLSHLVTRLDRMALLPAIADDPQGDAAVLLTGAREELDAVLVRFRALLRLSEIEAMHRLSQFAVFDPAEMIRDVAELYEPLAEERGIALTCTADPGLQILGDDRLLFEAMGNLVENAIKFGLPGGHVDLVLAAEQDQVVLSVIDDGPGIAPEDTALVLERFRRGGAAAMTGAGGSGLGLNLVAAIVALHGFALRLERAIDGARPGLAARIKAPGVR
jgi:signal transduction histidine kinase